MQIISPEAAKQLLGEHAVVISGMSFVSWDPKQFMTVRYEQMLIKNLEIVIL